jgi:hypothetical protein
MAIKIQGTTVIGDNRELQDITSINATTKTAIENAGIGGGGLSDIKFFDTPGTFTYTKPSGVLYIRVFCAGGGGGGGGAQTRFNSVPPFSRGGDAGSAQMAVAVLDASSISSVTVTVGGGGAGGASNFSANSHGSNGGASSFGSFVTSTGGGRGFGDPEEFSPSTGSPGSDGFSSGGLAPFMPAQGGMPGLGGEGGVAGYNSTDGGEPGDSGIVIVEEYS